MPSKPAILAEREGAVLRLTINRPPLNILDLETIRELSNSLNSLAEVKDTALRLVEIRGQGSKAFAAGTDIRDHFPGRVEGMLPEFHGLIRLLLKIEVLTLAIVDGYCLGGGMELAMACDFVIASSEARFGQPEIKLGAFPPAATVLLPHLIPEKRAAEIILTGEPVTAREAARLGLVNRVVARSRLEGEVRRFSASLLAHSPSVTRLALKSVRMARQRGFEAALRECERLYLEDLVNLPDYPEGHQAFLDKRPPRWSS
jgi:cyclohexa-1,5-dienecarbonyl-CoA hydratase